MYHTTYPREEDELKHVTNMTKHNVELQLRRINMVNPQIYAVVSEDQ